MLSIPPNKAVLGQLAQLHWHIGKSLWSLQGCQSQGRTNAAAAASAALCSCKLQWYQLMDVFCWTSQDWWRYCCCTFGELTEMPQTGMSQCNFKGQTILRAKSCHACTALLQKWHLADNNGNNRHAPLKEHKFSLLYTPRGIMGWMNK